MHTFTALFDRRAEAETIQAELESLGIVDLNHDLHDRVGAGLAEDINGPDATLWSKSAGAAPPREDRRIYEEAMRRGGFLLTVNVDDAEAERVHRILEGSDAVDFEERGRELHAAGVVPARAAGEGEQIIPIVEEQLTVGKREVERGGVRVRAYTVETPVRDQVRLREERISVERRDARGSAPGEASFQERSIELNATAEEAVVGKNTRVVEEVLVRKDVDERVETIEDTVRRTEVEVERAEGSTPETGRPS